MTDTESFYVSLHVPKTGGITFRQILEQKFGDRLQLAYDKSEGWPIVSCSACIHGHGVFKDFSDIITEHTEARWMTFLRDPLHSAISFYFFIKKYSLQKPSVKFVDRGLDIWLNHTEIFRWPDPPGYNHNRYKKWFEKRPIEQYDFVGLTEQFDESLVLLYHLFQWKPLYYKSENIGGYNPPDLSEEVVATFRELNAEDYLIYYRVVNNFEIRKKDYGIKFVKDLQNYRDNLKKYETKEPSNEPDIL